MITVYFCHRAEYLRIAEKIGYKLGTRADQYESNHIDGSELDISLVDNNFKEPDFERLWNVANMCDAEYVVVPDVYESQEIPQVLDWGDQLMRAGRTPIVVPKTVFDFSRIPSSWTLAFSVPSGYGETDVPITAFDTGHDVHLLGGSPQNQIEYATRAVENGINLVSADGNSFSKAAGYGNIINTPRDVLGDGNGWEANLEHPSDWGGRLVTSLVRYFLMWRDWSDEHGL